MDVHKDVHESFHEKLQEKLRTDKINENHKTNYESSFKLVFEKKTQVIWVNFQNKIFPLKNKCFFPGGWTLSQTVLIQKYYDLKISSENFLPYQKNINLNNKRFFKKKFPQKNKSDFWKKIFSQDSPVNFEFFCDLEWRCEHMTEKVCPSKETISRQTPVLKND